MKNLLLVRVALVCIILGVAADQADAISWVRGRGAVGSAGRVDNLIVEVPPDPIIPTVAAGQFNDGQKGFFSEADLGNGALRGHAFVNGGSGNANANPAMGETITFNNQTGGPSSWDFSYDVEGTVETGPNPFPIEQDFGQAGIFRTTFVQLGVHIFDGNTVGPTGSSNAWEQNLGNAIFSEVKNIEGFPTSGVLQDYFADLSDQISGTIPLQPGINTFDVVTILAVAGSIPSTSDSSFDMDFLNTAALTIDSAVPFESNSGVFLTGTNIIPEPSSFALLCLGAVGIGTRRRCRVRTCVCG